MMEKKVGSIYVDASYYSLVGGVRGIPRVVSAFCKGLMELEEKVRVVRFQSGSFYKTQLVENSCVKASGNRYFFYFREVYIALCNLMVSLLPYRWVRTLFLGSSSEVSLTTLILRCKELLSVSRFNSVAGEQNISEKISFGPEDLLFLPDAAWVVIPADAIKELSSIGVKVVFFCHDIIPITHPQYGSLQDDVFKTWLDETLPSFDKIICNSTYTADQLVHYLQFLKGAYSEKVSAVSVVRLGAEVDSSKVEFKRANKPYFLTVGAIDFRKNHAVLYAAAKLLWDAGYSFDLVWVGKCSNKMMGFYNEVRLGPYSDRIKLLQNISDDLLDELYNGASALVAPSLIEGYGLPLMEAMQRNVRIVLSDTDIHREVVGSCGVYFDADNVLFLARALSSVLDFSAEVPQYSHNRSWNQVCEELIAELRAVL